MIATQVMEMLYIGTEQVRPRSVDSAVLQMEDALETWVKQSPAFFSLAQPETPGSNDYFNIPWMFEM